MASPPEENASNWGFDDLLIEDLSPLDPCFQNAPLPLIPLSSSEKLDHSFRNSDCMKQKHHGPKKRLRLEACGARASGSKAFKEKLRRDKMNQRFQELSSILQPGRPPKMDKAFILSDAIRVLIQLREEANNLQQSCTNLQGKVNELKTQKNELRDEKLMLKSEKDKLENQLKALSTQRGFSPHIPPIPSPFLGSKLFPVLGFSRVPTWRLMPHTMVDTSEDHTLRPPVA